ncbi:MAG: hypothetical protein CSB48_11545 [Proteobacteria bacterium]|nr:MAG: hypothetical protein CSB48_11545 [Pseudomonadota bacterium]PIE40108.1 MAG: hypothetical protein CSA51_02400 [Gammaproteobacteria bacterium]
MKKTVALFSALLLASLSIPGQAGLITSGDIFLTNTPVSPTEGRVEFGYFNFSVSDSDCRGWSGQANLPCKYDFLWSATGLDLDVDMYLVNDNNDNNQVDVGDSLMGGRMGLGGFMAPSATLDDGNYIAVITSGDIGSGWLQPGIDDLFPGYGTTKLSCPPSSWGCTVTPPGTAVGNLEIAYSQFSNGTATVRADSANVSEPASIALLCLALSGLVYGRRRKV